ncbi:WD40-repeat-containing domain protein [Vararia minispora EC-137]|uniref:WD40-repeat-containing domain protein n=1 Tax=Vararia minispora EC-137 TaxID=1314806 RepID=A0ACB8Q8S2_9AGAM|nr:WD40-repeat-containing domain protein [Vararia minispora EC-137]
MDPVPSSSSVPSTSSVPFPRQPRPRFGPRSPGQRPTAFIVSDAGSPFFHHRFYTEPIALHANAFDLDFVDGAFSAVPHSMTITRPSSPAPTMDFSIINPPSPEPESDPGPSQSTFHRPRHRRFNTIYGNPSPSRGMKNIFPRLWGALSSPARKNRSKSSSDSFVFNSYLSYADLPPLDGEEGELIDDEACFMGRDGASATSGIDLTRTLPPELCVLVFRYLDLASVLACQRVSRRWRRLADDNTVWRDLFFRRDGWAIDLARPTAVPPATPSTPDAPLTLPWRRLYRARQTLDERWSSPAFPPQTMRITGHTNSVYCLEFDSTRIVTGARDHTVRVWRIADGACLGILRAHTGSVLCLKFERDWDVHPGGAPGLLVTGSSDRTVRVWDLHALPGGTVCGDERAVLSGHTGGVLDLRVDARWIVSSSKDSCVFVWDRATLALHRTLVGHEGPVNSIALQAGRLVSASGDGRIMLWDVASGECLRVFEHLRGLACVEYKGDTIISGSNDSKIKIWSASTGECLRTLSGHTELVRALSFDPASGRLVSASYDMSVRVWDVRSGRLVREFLRHQGSHILDVKFDARKIVSVSFDKTILVADFSEGLDADLFV